MMTDYTPDRARALANLIADDLVDDYGLHERALRSLADQVEALTAELAVLSHPKSNLADSDVIANGDPSAWQIKYARVDGTSRTVVHEHNAIGDYRLIDPSATSTPLYAAPVVPAPGARDQASLIADAQDAFDAQYPLPSNCTRFTGGYASTGYSAWMAHDHCKKWEGWKAAWLLLAATQQQGDVSLIDEGKTVVQPPQQSAQPVAAANGWAKGLEIRMSQGWKLKGGICPVLYSDTVNGYGVGRDDLWLATTDALKSAQPVEVQRVPLTDATQFEKDVARWMEKDGLTREQAECEVNYRTTRKALKSGLSAHGIKPTSSEGGA